MAASPAAEISIHASLFRANRGKQRSRRGQKQSAREWRRKVQGRKERSKYCDAVGDEEVVKSKKKKSVSAQTNAAQARGEANRISLAETASLASALCWRCRMRRTRC